MEPRPTSSVSAASNRLRRHRHAGFSLIELLVVIGVLTILIGLLVPGLYKAYKSAQRTRFASELQVISQALDAYKADFGDIPRTYGNYAGGTNSCLLNGGAATLGKALIGPGPNWNIASSAILCPGSTAPNANYDATVTYLPGQWCRTPQTMYVAVRKIVPPATAGPVTDGPDPYWTPIDVRNGADGPGFRTGVGANPVSNTGKVWGPYLQAEKFKMQGLAILDPWDGPILYFPGSPGKPNANIANGYVDQTLTTNTIRVKSMYDASDNIIIFQRTGDAALDDLKRIRAMLGDLGNGAGGAQNGGIDAGETAATTGPYILWSAGPDGFFGPKFTGTPTSADVTKCDDVTNFQ